LGVLYIVSAEEAVGKTAICAGIAINLLNAGKKAGYLKPQAAEKNTTGVGVSDGDIADGDIAFMRKTLGLTDLINAPDLVTGRDIVLVEARLGATPNTAASKDAYGAAKEMKAKVIAVESYSPDNVKHADLYKGFGESFLGVIINKVPRNIVKKAREAAAFNPVKVLGVIPENRTLLAITVAELAEGIKGKIINHTENEGELVENFMLGALTPDSGLEYFGRKSRKAAVIRQDRADMQLAALETPTIALVSACSSQPPIYSVINKAQQKGIPVITTASGITDVINNIESSLARTRLNQEKKLTSLGDIVKQNLDMKIFG